MSEMIPIERITLDPKLQSRVRTMADLVRDYAVAMRGGAQFPPVVLYKIDDTLLLADGFHRVEARKRLRQSDVLADIREGTWRDAFLFAREFNMLHGYRLNREEVQNAIDVFLTDKVWSLWADREIARRLNVSHRTVGARRKALDLGEDDAEPLPADAPARTGQVAHPLPTERTQQTQAKALLAAYHTAVDALTAAEGVDQVQVEVQKWWGAVSAGGAVKFEPAKRSHHKGVR